jgi:DoxX-like family
MGGSIYGYQQISNLDFLIKIVTYMKSTKTIYWVTTIIIIIFEGVMPAFTSQSEMAKTAMNHLGYPPYFGIMLMVFKVIGVLAIAIPMVPRFIKDAAYAGLMYTLIAALWSNTAVDGFGVATLMPIIGMGIVWLSYTTSHKLAATNS